MEKEDALFVVGPMDPPRSQVGISSPTVEVAEKAEDGWVGLLEGQEIVGGDGILPFREAKARVVEHFEREYVLRILRACGGNISQAARASGMDRKNFWEKMKRHAIEAQDFA
jgi:DNA-binding NtrC family response regulator